MTLLTKESIVKGLENKDIKVDVLQKTESTNDYFENITSDSPYVCVSDFQSKGRGRLNREWISPSGSNIYLSLLYRFYKYTNQLNGLSLSTGLAIREALMSSSGAEEIKVKWPNDIMHDGKKLAGILIETKTIENQFYAVVGIGVNVNMEESEEEIRGKWTSLSKITGKEQNRSELISNIVNNVIRYYKKLERYGFSQFASEWEENDVLRGRQVKIRQSDRIFEGPCLGVDECGRLSVRTDTGVKFFNYGEVTTR